MELVAIYMNIRKSKIEAVGDCHEIIHSDDIVHKLRVRVISGTLSMYINGRIVEESSMYNYHTNRIGSYVSFYGEERPLSSDRVEVFYEGYMLEGDRI